jgi:hypothetical protein
MFPFEFNYNVSILNESMESYGAVQSDERMKKGLDLLERKYIARQVGSGIYYGFVEFV